MEKSQVVKPASARRHTRASVKLADEIARIVITVGGLGTIAAVLGVCLFLFWVVWPLFTPPKADTSRIARSRWSAQLPLRFEVNDTNTIAWALTGAGALVIFDSRTGKPLRSEELTEGVKITAVSVASPGDNAIAIGLADGSWRFGEISFRSESMARDGTTRKVIKRVGEVSAPPGEATDSGQQRGNTAQNQPQVLVNLNARGDTGDKSLVRLIDCSRIGGRSAVATIDERGEAAVTFVASMGESGDERARHRGTVKVNYQKIKHDLPGFMLFLNADLLIAWPDGTLARFDVTPREVKLVETLDLLKDDSARLTALALLAGRGTLIVGDSTGDLSAWFLTMPEQTASSENRRLTLAHQLPRRQAPVTALDASQRDRVVAAGYADGRVCLFQVTTERRLLNIGIEGNASINGLAISPRLDLLLAMTKRGIARVNLDLRHPDATLASLFLPVWYEDYEGPAQVWQSSGGSEANEPKFGVVPLIFGTVKATFYSLLFAVPIALMAAIYTSEFLVRTARLRIKPTIELMASLPSVVLGYLAAFVVAPFVARYVPTVLTSFLVVPVTFLFVAYLLQLLPERIGVRLKNYRFLLVCIVFPLGLALASAMAPAAEQWLFDGDMIRWLASDEGSPTGGWLILFLPAAAVAIGYFVAREVTPRLRRISTDWSPFTCGLVDLLKFLAGSGVALGGALLISVGLSRLGFDPRGWYVGTYLQRNAMIVGFAMGFAVVPLIYTIAEDALSSVPEHLRSASLGAGATPWQTTTRIIVPTAMSGLFSAVMIGLGRAVGETMIVLMAAGNTPIMDWNIFNGFRTLSANLAVELPEAEQGSTHFRILFLTALALFVLTFVVNSIAEAVRQRFRRRAYQL